MVPTANVAVRWFWPPVMVTVGEATGPLTMVAGPLHASLTPLGSAQVYGAEQLVVAPTKLLGQAVNVGPVLSRTVTVNVQVLELELTLLSVAVYVMVYGLPDKLKEPGASEDKAIGLPQLSVGVGVVQLGVAAQVLSALTVRFAGQVRFGFSLSETVTVKEQKPMLLLASADV